MSWLESRGQWFLEDKAKLKYSQSTQKENLNKIQNHLESSQNQTNQER